MIAFRALDAGVWNLPPTRTKNKRSHVVPLPPTALALLGRRRAAVPTDETRVFPGLTLTSDADKSLSDLHGGRYKWRGSCGARLPRILAGLGFDETTIGRTLNHARVTALKLRIPRIKRPPDFV